MKKTATNNRIILDTAIMVGKPIVKGTRLTVEFLLRQLAHGMTTAELLAHYPQLAAEDVAAAINYATDLVAEEKVYPLEYHSHGTAPAFA